MSLLEAIIGNAVYDLTNGPIIWTGDDGLGMLPIERITEQGPLQDGDSDLGERLRPRTIQLKLEILPSDLVEHWNQRDQLLRIFRPGRTPITLRLTLDNGAVRCIDGFTSGGLSFGSDAREGFVQATVASIRCADPTFYNPELQSFTFNIGGGSAGFVVPVVVPFGIGTTNINQTRTITYAGSWRSYPQIRIRGPITDPVITNQATGDKLDFTGTTIGGGAYYDLDLRYGYKTVLDQAGVNRVGTLTNDSDLATFSLEADPDVAGGLNTLLVTGTSVTSATEIYLSWYERFVGV